MAKKSFKAGFDSLLGEDITSTRKENSTSKKNIKNETRATFLVETEQLEKIKAISYWDRKLIKNVLFDALEMYIEHYQKTKGDIKTPDM